MSGDTDAVLKCRFFAWMYTRALHPFLLCLLCLGCRARPAETGRAPTTDTDDLADTEQSGPPVGAAHGAVEFEAPPLIPAMRAQLDQVARPEVRHDPSGITSYRGAVSRLVEAMETDLARVGLADSGAFKLLSDSVLNDSVDTDRIRRLITLYESWMRQVPK